jgi:RimJ/RimL family protein N-acetyltransferase
MRLQTTRLILRPWEHSDRESAYAIDGDPEVRHYFYPQTMTRADSKKMLDWIVGHWAEHGFGFFAVIRKDTGEIIGGCGLSVLDQALPGNPKIEIGWIFARSAWGNGFAREAAVAVLAYAWTLPGIDEVVAFTTESNLASRKLSERIGMTRDPADDFEDDTVPAGHWQRPHVLYRIGRPNPRA